MFQEGNVLNWTIDQLRAFVTAAEKGSFSAAGRAMGKAQSVVSTHIAMLEDSLGVELFDRSSRSPVLTEAGRVLLPEAYAVLRQSHRFESCAIAQYGGEAVMLNIVVSHGVPFQGISEGIASLSEKYPFLSGSFHIISLDSVWNLVSEGKAQIGIVGGHLPEIKNNCEVVCLGQMRYCLVASKESPLGQMKHVTVEDLAQYRQIVFNRSRAEQYLLSSQYWEVNDVLAAIYWASLGIGWAAVPLGLANRIMRDRSMQNLGVLDMENMALISHNIYLIWNNAFSRRDILEVLCRDLKSYYQQAFEQEDTMF